MFSLFDGGDKVSTVGTEGIADVPLSYAVRYTECKNTNAKTNKSRKPFGMVFGGNTVAPAAIAA